MSTSTLGLFLRQLALNEEVNRLGTTSDHMLLAAYESESGQDAFRQAAFTELMRRHGPMVLRTCRRVLKRETDAEDAFQATFIFLSCQASQLRREAAGRQSLGSWLHRVAYRTALQVLRRAVRRKSHERQASAMTYAEPDPVTRVSWNEIWPILDAELDALPDEARRLLIACYLQEKTHTQAAAELGLPPGSLARHLEKARKLLAARLARRGITVSSILLAALLGDSAKGAGVPAVLLVHTLEAARTFTGQAVGVLSENIARLVKGGLANMAKGWTHLSMALAGWVSLLGAGLIACQTLKAWPDHPPESESPATSTAERPAREAEKATRTDCFGDPLPAHAVARMGTVRLWRSRGWDGNNPAPAFSPDGKTLAAHIDGMTVCLWDAATGKEIRRLTTKAVKGVIVSLGFSPDGKKLVAINYDQTVCRWEVATGKFLRKEEYQGPKRDNVISLKVAFLPDGQMLGYGNFLKSVENGKGVRGAYVWDAATGKEICQLNRPLKEEEGGHQNTVFSRDGKMLATAVRGIYLWDVATGKEIRQLAFGEGNPNLAFQDRDVNAVAFSPDGKTLASGDREKICVWEVATGKSIHVFNEAEGFPCNLLSYSPDGKSLLGGSERESHLWDVATGKKIRSFGWKEAIVALFSPDGKTLATGDEAGSIRLWEVATGKEIGPRQGFRGSIQWVAYSPDGKTLASMGAKNFGKGGDHQTVHLWEVATGKEIRQLAKGGSSFFAYSPDGKILVSTMNDGVLHLWDTATGKEIRQFDAANFNPRSATFSPDGKKLAARIRNGPMIDLWVWEVDTGKKIYALATRNEDSNVNDNVGSIAFSPDGRMLAVADEKENAVSLWEIATGTRVDRLGGPKQPVRQEKVVFVRFLAFSPDGRMLATSSWNDDKVRLWEVASGKEIWQLDAYNQRKGERGGNAAWEGCSLAFSPDGRMLATAAQGRNRQGEPDREVRLWEVVSGKEIGQLAGHQSHVGTIAFSPDGKTLASGSSDLTCLIWDVTPFGGRLQPVPARPLPAQALSKERLEAAWADLARDSAKAYVAVGILQAAPAQAISLLQARVRPVVPLANLRQLQGWIADLDADSFAVRDKAQREIGKLGEPALAALRQALKGQPSLETRRRLKDLLAGLEPKLVGGSPQRLRAVRAVQVLESIGTAEARQLLQALAKGAPEARLTREARVALARLAKRSAAKP